MGFLKKVLKVVAVVAAVALAIPTGGGSLLAVGLGISAIGATALVAGLTIASGLLNQPKSPQVSNAAIDRLNLSIDPRTPRKIIFGETAMASDLRDYEYTGTDDEYVHYFIVNASHKIDGHTRIYLDDKLAWTAAGGVQGEFVGYLTVATRSEGSAANAIDISARMGNTRRYTGCAYIHLRFKRTGNSKKAESPFAQSIPQRFTTIGRGMPVYDPRQDSTVPGGSGTHRATDQATWTYGDHARNPALQLLTYLLGWRINGKLAVGKGIPVARLHLESFMAAANACDEPVILAAGGTEPRYRSDGIFSEADDMTLVLDAFKTTMNAEIDDSDGRFAVRLMLDDLADPIAHFDMDDFLSGLTWSPISDISNRFNVVRGQFTDARAPSLYQLVDYPEVSIASVDGIERSHNFTLPLVQSPSQAQRLAKQVLQRQQYSGTLEVQVGHTGWRVQKYDIVTISHPPLGFNAKLFRVAAMTVGTHGQVQLTLREENEAIYAWDSDERPPVNAAEVTTYIYGNNPLLQGLGNITYRQPEAPTVGLTEGDIWIDSDNGDILYRWDGTAWIEARDVGAESGEAGLNLDGTVRPDKVITDSIVPGAITASQIITAPNQPISAGAPPVTFLETPPIIVGDLEFSSTLINLNFTLNGDLPGQSDASAYFRLFVDTGSGFVLRSAQVLGVSTTDGDTYTRASCVLQTVIASPSFIIRATAESGIFVQGGASRDIRVEDIVLSLLGNKR